MEQDEPQPEYCDCDGFHDGSCRTREALRNTKLKCTMIHSYPKQYHALYDSFKDGGTIRKWVNAVEKMGREILESNPEINRVQLVDQLPDDWTIAPALGGFIVAGPKNPQALHVMRTMGATWVMDQQHWAVTYEQLAEYINKEDLYKFKGDMLEVLSEIFFTIFQGDEGLGIREYTPVEIAEDFGVDATGVNVNGHKVVVQVKYRSNPDDLIPFADIARTFTSAVCQLRITVVIQHPRTVYLFTISNGVTAAFQKVMGDKTVLVNRATIATKIDNNCNFWKMAFEMMMTTLQS